MKALASFPLFSTTVAREKAPRPDSSGPGDHCTEKSMMTVRVKIALKQTGLIKKKKKYFFI